MENTQSRVFITNLAQYNDGRLVGEWFTLSDGHKALKEVLRRILGNDEEYFITDYEADFDINEYDNLTELVNFAMLFDKLEGIERAAVTYWLDFFGSTRDEVIEMMKTETLLDNCIVYEASDETELGMTITEGWEIPKHLEMYINYEAIGRDEVYSGATQVEDYFFISC